VTSWHTVTPGRCDTGSVTVTGATCQPPRSPCCIAPRDIDDGGKQLRGQSSELGDFKECFE